ncbi:MAG: Na/Pi cotransporter family protein [Spirochaetes bacterium]|nr:MAG: Na/Pi cotransporter family protein [Spirochaetota bacterium]
MILVIFGGIGIFLVGMILMTDGLKSVGGDTLRASLTRFTGGPVSAIASGFAVTSLLQASAATILATIGFVSAGFISFTQAIFIIFGANLGTSVTGWIVSLLGFQVKLGIMAMPLVGVGALMMLLLHGKNASRGMVLAGFGLLFVGIDTLQLGMRDMALYADVGTFPGTGWAGRLALIGIGVLMAALMQSQSAALVTALAALNTGNVSLEQAAAIVIGQSIGKTSTAAIAAFGASVLARRAALVHISFNFAAAALAYLLFPQFILAVRGALGTVGVSDPAILLSAFFTMYYLAGIVALFPLVPRLRDFIERVLPERGSGLTRNLDSNVSHVPAVAVEAARRATVSIAAHIMLSLRGLMDPEIRYREIETRLEESERALRETSRFLGGVRSRPGMAAVHQRHLSLLHAVDHLDRIVDACREKDEIRTVAHVGALRTVALDKLAQLDSVMGWLQGYSNEAPVPILEAMSQSLAGIRKAQRAEVLELTATGAIGAEHALEQLEAMRWLDRLAYHIWRAIYHLSETLQEKVAAPADAPRSQNGRRHGGRGMEI